MGINLGIALGSAAKSGLDTYRQLQEEQRLADEESRKKEQFSAWRQEQAEQKAIRDTYKETYGNVGNQDYTQGIQTQGGVGSQQAQMLADQTKGFGDDNAQAAATSAVNALRENANQAPVASAIPSTPYSDKQAAADFRSKLASAGVDPMKAVQLSGAMRTERNAAKMEAFQDWHDDVQTRIAKGDLAGLVKDNIGLYNNPPKGTHLDDGLTAEVVPSGDPNGPANFVQKDKNGKVVASTPITQEMVQSQLDKLAYAKYKSLDFKGGEELALKGREVGVKEKVAPSEIEKNLGAAYESKQKGGYYGTLSSIKADEDNVKKAAEPFKKAYDALSDQDKNGPKGQQLLDKMEMAVALKSNEFSKIRAATPLGRAEAQFQQSYAAWDKNGRMGTAPSRDEAFASYGIATAPLEAAAKNRVDALMSKGKVKEAEAEIAKFNNQFKHTPLQMERNDKGELVSKVAPTGAIPVNNPAPAPSPVVKSSGDVQGALPIGETNWAKNVASGKRAGVEKDIADLETKIAAYGENNNSPYVINQRKKLEALRNSIR